MREQRAKGQVKKQQQQQKNKQTKKKNRNKHVFSEYDEKKIIQDEVCIDRFPLSCRKGPCLK